VARYANLDGSIIAKGFGDLLRWQGEKLFDRRHAPKGYETPRAANSGVALANTEPSLTWIGHATFVARLGKKLIATDPIWSSRIHAIGRKAEPGVAFENVPPIDIVTISHSHYDHLDLPTLKRIGPKAHYIVPKDVGEILTSEQFPHVTELGWFETVTVEDVRITLVPAHHWSMRTPWDRNRRLWGGFVYESKETSLYHSGDTAFNEAMFRTIHDHFPNIGWAMLPIGAYDPEWFMQSQHIGPEDAVRAFQILGAKKFVAMHWGTFALTDEPLNEPPLRTRAGWEKAGLPPGSLFIPALGETIQLTKY